MQFIVPFIIMTVAYTKVISDGSCLGPSRLLFFLKEIVSITVWDTWETETEIYFSDIESLDVGFQSKLVLDLVDKEEIFASRNCSIII